MDREPLIYFIESNSPCDRPTASQIAAHFAECFFPKNDYFLRAGRVSTDYLFLADGFMRAFTLDTNGNEVTTHFFAKNRVVFEVSSLFLHTASTENIQALAVGQGYYISFDQLNRLFHALPEFREFGRTMLVKEFARFKQRTLELINKTAEERYVELITSNKAVFQYAQLRHIASYLGVTDSSLSRIRREYARKS